MNTIIYDGSCGLCNAIVKFIRERDRYLSFRYVALQSAEGQELLDRTGLPEKDRNTVIYFCGEIFHIRSTAVLKILKDMGGAWKLLYLFIIIPRFIRDFFYRLVARYRYQLFSRVHGET